MVETQIMMKMTCTLRPQLTHTFWTIIGLQADPSVKIKVEPGLFEYKMWHMSKGMAPFMTPLELYKHGLNVDLEWVTCQSFFTSIRSVYFIFLTNGTRILKSPLLDIPLPTNSSSGPLIGYPVCFHWDFVELHYTYSRGQRHNYTAFWDVEKVPMVTYPSIN